MSAPVTATTGSSTTGSSDVVSVLSGQHEHLKALMTQVLSSNGPTRQSAFDQVCFTLAAHEAAEAEVIHPLARHDLSAGQDAVVTDRLAEEDQAGAAVGKLEQLDIDSEDFTTEFAALQKAVIAHAEAEEHQELPSILGAIDADQQHEMLAALAQVPDLARPGPLTANGASFAAMLQTARDHFHRPLTV
jgi:hemerythrin superfamily protein